MTHGATETSELDSTRNQRIQRREWIAERAGMSVVVGILIVAVIGYFGGGSVMEQTTRSADGEWSVEHRTIQRFSAPEKLAILVPQKAGRDTIRVLISRSFTEQISSIEIRPTPYLTEMRGPYLVYSFRTSGRDETSAITFLYKNERFGRRHFQIRLDDGSPVSLSQFIWP